MKVVRKGGTEKLQATLKDVSSKQIRVGFFPEATYPDGTSIAYVATIQEFGYPQGSIPARPFMRPTAEQKKAEWGRQIAGAIRGAIDGRVDLAQGFEALGSASAGDIGRTIARITSPPLSDITIELRRSRKAGNETTGRSVGEAAKATKSAFWSRGSNKGEAKPLVDSGLLIQAVTHVVEDKS